MNLAAFAMRRPVTILVGVIALALLSWVAARRMPRDIFPNLGIPVIYIAQPYGGMDPAQVEGYITNYYEYHSLYVTGIEHIESKSIQGVALIKLQFHPGTDMARALVETVSNANRSRAFMPQGTVPPFITRFDAGSVPVGFLVFSSETKNVGELQEMALNRVRPLFATLPGVSAPPPFGASQRSIVVRIDPERLRAYSMSPDEVVTAISNANVLSPSGNVRIGDYIPMVPLNSVAQNVKDLEAVPIRTGSTQTVYLRDVGVVQDSTDITTGFALVNGRRTVYIPVTKRADASTMSVIHLVKQNMPTFQAQLSDDVNVSFEFDQSPYVTRAISGLITEGLLGAVLTGFMILLFLRDWRAALVVVVNIPLSPAASLFALWLMGATVNLMTLGGLALAVGVLVDEATVTIENIHTYLENGVSSRRAALEATAETALPRLLAMLCIVAVFVPSFFMTGAGRALFVPLSLAVGFSMLASYLLSSTLVPILCAWLLPEGHGRRAPKRTAFATFREAYEKVAVGFVQARWVLVPVYLAAAGAALYYLVPALGTEIFPKVDMGQFQLRLRAPTGTRIERTEAIAQQTLNEIKNEAGADNLDITMGFVGTQPPGNPVNTIHLWTGGPEEAVLQIALKRGAPIPVDELKERLRGRLAEAMPDVKFSFEPSDIISRVMSFGSPTPIEVAVTGPEMASNRAFAEKLRKALAEVHTLRDLQIVQTADFPTVEVRVDRERAGCLGITMKDVSRALVAATSSSRFVTPVHWVDPKSGVAYQVQVEIPQGQMNSVEQISTIPIARNENDRLLLQDVAEVTQGVTVGKYERYNMQRTISMTANIFDEDLGNTAARVAKAIAAAGEPPVKVSVALRGQVGPLQQTLGELRTGLLLAIAVILLMLAANFQSFILSIAVVSTVPAVLVGVAAALEITGTTMNIQSVMGAIMAIGVSVANAILLVTFAERYRAQGETSARAAAMGAASRLRPILMTSVAMIAGMLQMALAWGGGCRAGRAARACGNWWIGRGDDRDAHDFTGGVRTRPPQRGASPRVAASRRPGTRVVMTRRTSMNMTRPAKWVCIGAVCVCISWAQPPAAAPAEVPTVTVASPRKREITQKVKLPGNLIPDEQVSVYAKVSGYLDDISVDRGETVAKNQVIAKLSAPEMESELALAEAKLRAAQSRTGRARANAEFAKTTHQRVGKLHAAEPGAVTQEDVDDAEAKDKIAQADVVATDAEVGVAAADVKRLKTMIDYLTVRAPFDGVVTERFMDSGAFIAAGTGAKPIVEITRINKLRLAFDLPERLAPFVKTGRPVTYSLTALPGKSFDAAISRRTDILAPNTRTMRAEVDIENTDGALSPGMYASVQIPL